MGSKYKQDFLTFTTPLERRIPRPGPSQQTIQDRRLAALEEKCAERERA